MTTYERYISIHFDKPPHINSYTYKNFSYSALQKYSDIKQDFTNITLYLKCKCYIVLHF